LIDGENGKKERERERERERKREKYLRRRSSIFSNSSLWRAEGKQIGRGFPK
jgi:hypothetical protein